jgi:hypothetical protein
MLKPLPGGGPRAFTVTAAVMIPFLLAGCQITGVPKANTGVSGGSTFSITFSGDLALSGSGRITGCGTDVPFPSPPSMPSPPPGLPKLYVLSALLEVGGSPGRFSLGVPVSHGLGTYALSADAVNHILVRVGDKSNPFLSDSTSYNRSVSSPNGHRTWIQNSGNVKLSSTGGEALVDMAPVRTDPGFQFVRLGPSSLHLKAAWTC